MSGFNKINQIQPTRSLPTPLAARGRSSSTMMWQQPSHTMTPAKHSHLQENSTPAKRLRDYVCTPMQQGSRQNPQELHNAPIKKRVTESQ